MRTTWEAVDGGFAAPDDYCFQCACPKPTNGMGCADQACGYCGTGQCPCVMCQPCWDAMPEPDDAEGYVFPP